MDSYSALPDGEPSKDSAVADLDLEAQAEQAADHAVVGGTWRH